MYRRDIVFYKHTFLVINIFHRVPVFNANSVYPDMTSCSAMSRADSEWCS